MSFDDIGLLVNILLEKFVPKENAEIEKASAISKEIRIKLKKIFKLNLSSEMKIQKAEEEIESTPEPIKYSTPLKKEEIEKTSDEQKETF